MPGTHYRRFMALSEGGPVAQETQITTFGITRIVQIKNPTIPSFSETAVLGS